MSTLQSWVDEFYELGFPVSGSIRVVPQDGEGGSDTGLVSVMLPSVEPTIYLEPESPGSTHWAVTFERREDDVSLDAATLLRLVGELATLSALCTFLEAKSRAFVEIDQP
jgi:hypothetical protein